jgi:putative membrane-bound dehydrogenase-like protein
MRQLQFILLLTAIPTVHAWEPGKEAPNMPSNFQLPDGLEITPWATSPALFNPTNLDIDHLGRVWVTEGVNYRGRANRQAAGDRIVILQDTDGDGKADSSKVFWQDPELVSPLGIAVFDNVVIVSQPPNLLKLTDVDRDGVFNPSSGDKREVLLTGFNGKNHDHSLHSLTAGPDGKWYFNQGNTGAIFTDGSGRTFPIGSSYYRSGGGEWPMDTKAASGQESADGFVYVGGFTVRMNPDATRAEIIGHGYRNSFEQTINSLGYVFQNDNDDPPACRTSHVLEHGNAGFFSNDGTRSWQADQRPGQDTPTAHWRQENPGSMPAGDVYGGGSPTGIAFYENGALGETYIGTLLSCEAARNVIFGYQPAKDGAGFKLDRTDFLTTNPEKQFDGADFTNGARKHHSSSAEDKAKFSFRPSDICVGADGALYVSDWTDPRVGGHDTQDDAASGIIYRIAPKGFRPSVPKIDPTSLEGALLALKSPAVNVRWLGFQRLKSSGPAGYNAVSGILADPNPFIASRAIWLLPYLGTQGIAKLDSLISGNDVSNRMTAFRAIRRSDGAIDPLPYAIKLSKDSDPALRAEAAISARYLAFEKTREVLVNVATRYDGNDRAYLESIGLGAGKHAESLWKAVGQSTKPGVPTNWSDAFARLTWRLMPEAAVPSLKARALASGLSDANRKLAVDSIAFIKSKASASALMEIAAAESPVRDSALWWLMNRSEGEWASFDLRPELERRNLIAKPVNLTEITVPAKPQGTKFTVADVMALKGDAARGKVSAARCIMCHKIGDGGPDYGPELKGFGSRQPADVVARGIIDPSFDISHGFEGSAIRLKDGKWIDGRIIADGDPVVIRSTGGVTQKVPAQLIVERKKMDRSLMLGADQLGMSAQDVADVVEWLKTY